MLRYLENGVPGSGIWAWIYAQLFSAVSFRHFRLSLAALSVLLVGCVSIPAVKNSPETPQEALARHVKFLAQPALKGRALDSHGSTLAREYIESRFKAYGLQPWEQEHSYEVPFHYGVNVVGVLPGSDTNLASEIVLLCAHYDHLGKDSQGRICPGAADNASGVAALLETARQVCLREPRPRRTVCFAAFDGEEKMLLGSFAFTCRPDVQQAKLAGVINVDMLGRDFLDVVTNTLFLAGSESYPNIRKAVCQAGTEAAIRVLPVGTDLIGPRGDHAAFESRPIPVLFFSCGTFKDYHCCTDTADKLNYAELGRSTAVVLSALEQLANGAAPTRSTATADADAEDLKSVNTVMSEAKDHRAEAGIRSEDAEAFEKLARAANALQQAGNYDHRKRAEFVVAATGVLAPSLFPASDVKGTNDTQRSLMIEMAQLLEQVYLNHRLELLEGYRGIVSHLLKYRPGLFRGMPNFEFEICHLADDDIRLTERGGNRYALDVLITPTMLWLQTGHRLGLIPTFNFTVMSSFNGIAAEGTREQLADLCLLRLGAEGTNAAHAAMMRKVLKVLTGTQPEGTYQELLKQRLAQGQFTNEAAWLAVCIQSRVPELALAALNAPNNDQDELVRQAACKIIADRNQRADVRAMAIRRIGTKRDKDALLALSAVLDDTTLAFSNDFLPALRPDYPFADRLEVKTLRPLVERYASWGRSGTVADAALAQLKQATHKDFGKQAKLWEDWIEAHVKPG
jgi:hypothetical protein